MYWGMVSFITPPVALAAFAAAPLARCSPFAIGFEAMRMGSIMYFVPFFFVLNPALILRGPPWEIAVVTITAVIGIVLIGGGLQGYLLGVGRIEKTLSGWIARLLLLLSGLFFAAPGGSGIGLGHVELSLIGVVLAAAAIVLMRLRRADRPVPAAVRTPST
jgi:TRAP-type uncharacterized transport system fused permease subunit